MDLARGDRADSARETRDADRRRAVGRLPAPGRGAPATDRAGVRERADMVEAGCDGADSARQTNDTDGGAVVDLALDPEPGAPAHDFAAGERAGVGAARHDRRDAARKT